MLLPQGILRVLRERVVNISCKREAFRTSLSREIIQYLCGLQVRKHRTSIDPSCSTGGSSGFVTDSRGSGTARRPDLFGLTGKSGFARNSRPNTAAPPYWLTVCSAVSGVKPPARRNAESFRPRLQMSRMKSMLSVGPGFASLSPVVRGLTTWRYARFECLLRMAWVMNEKVGTGSDTG